MCIYIKIVICIFIYTYIFHMLKNIKKSYLLELYNMYNAYIYIYVYIDYIDNGYMGRGESPKSWYSVLCWTVFFLLFFFRIFKIFVVFFFYLCTCEIMNFVCKLKNWKMKIDPAIFPHILSQIVQVKIYNISIYHILYRN